MRRKLAVVDYSCKVSPASVVWIGGTSHETILPFDTRRRKIVPKSCRSQVEKGSQFHGVPLGFYTLQGRENNYREKRSGDTFMLKIVFGQIIRKALFV